MNEPISLSKYVIAKLYKDNIVITDKIEENLEPEKSADVNILFLGENKKNIVILLKEEDAMHLKDDSFQFLSSILQACKLNMADVAIINYNNQSINLNKVTKQFAPKFVIIFGELPNTIKQDATIDFYTPININSAVWLKAAVLDEMKENSTNAKVEKSKLWNCLKQIFKL
ncbi:MAG TPA: hypothetical protein PLY81_04175 [Chitinophagaceae bacterium]|nr:hypothetical protein [Chitinophagaceae bacterium]MCC6635434.1 hypothetical protein [Chitinophagaceae bacterium]HNE93351.1 hypothetical protein [Chitinophagaceae bacterium]HNF29454.1 hypothetical protein [Chitinophagaceae bacterium]HNJ59262.1 hypothetical protein [Chitinophagaceae bacterium]